MKTKFHPILFSTPMVLAILEGTKTQTRRIVKDKMLQDAPADVDFEFIRLTVIQKYEVGDILWVRETFETVPVQKATVYGTDSVIEHVVKYKADGSECLNKWKPSIFMPKPACRIFLKIKSIRLERLQEISESDAKAEGVAQKFSILFNECRYKDYANVKDDWRSAVGSFQSLWASINGIDAWDEDPFVWVYEFEKIEKPDDFI
jgi:hypothetical protein